MWLFILVVIAVLSFIVTVLGHQAQKKPETFNGKDTISQVSTTAKHVQVDTYKYRNKKLGFTIEIPRTWNQLTQNGNTTFMDRNTGATLEIEIDKYDPNVNVMDNSNASTQIPDNMVFEGFTKDTGSPHYELRYQDMSSKSPYDYLEEVYWDRDHIVKLLCIFPDKYYKDLTSYYTTIIDSFDWNSSNPVPSGYNLVYINNDSYSFEFGMPSENTWSTGTQNGVIVAQDTKTGMQMTLSTIADSNPATSITGSDVAQLLSSNRANFIMENLNTSKDYAQATSTYVVNNQQWIDKSYIFSDGYNWYIQSFDYQNGSNTDIPDTSAKLFRSFLPEKVKEWKKHTTTTTKQNKKKNTKKTPQKSNPKQESTTMPYATHKSHNQIGQRVD